jgi:putative ABC transport system permease protein
MDSLRQDIRYAIRMWARTPAFTTVAILALAIGIGANTAIFTIVNAVLIERLPFRDPDRLVVVWEQSVRRPSHRNTISPANFLQWQERNDVFEQMASFYEWRANLTGQANPEEVAAQDVTSNFFATLGVTPILGRSFVPEEGPEGRDRVVILSHGLWQRRFGGDPDVIGKAIQLNSRPFTVIGVMPPDMKLLLKAGSLVGKMPELWTPFAYAEAMRQPRGRYALAIARLTPGVTLSQAQAQMTTIAASLATEWRDFDTGWGVRLVPIHDELGGDLRRPLLVLMGAVAFVLLIACANVANLLLARGAAREREIAVRLALGAPRSRLMRQLLTESLVLGVLGGLAGLVVARWGLAFLLAISPVDLTGLGHIGLSYPVLAFTATIAILTAVISGFAPAFESSRVAVKESLKDGARQVGSGTRSRRVRYALVVSEIALAVVLLTGAGLLLRTFASMRAIDPGFESRNVLTTRVSLPFAKYKEDAQRLRFFEQAVERIGALPGVQSAGAISFLPFAGLGAATDFTVVGQPPPAPGQGAVVDVRVCDNGFFTAMGVPLVRGRLFNERELRELSNVVIVNEALVRQHLPGEDPLGKQLVIDMSDNPSPTTIIGVVGDVRYMDLVTRPRPMSYWPHPQLAYGAMTVTVRTSTDPLALAPAVERAIQSIDKDQPVSDVRTMDQWITKSLAQARFNALLLGLFAATALLLASLGIYGVMSYAVSQRTSEIGVRLALGADEHAILRLIVGNGVALAAGGLAIGVLMAFALSRTMSSLLYETSGTDPVTFVSVVVTLGAVAVLASYLPARRASHITPVEALRYQ